MLSTRKRSDAIALYFIFYELTLKAYSIFPYVATISILHFSINLAFVHVTAAPFDSSNSILNIIIIELSIVVLTFVAHKWFFYHL